MQQQVENLIANYSASIEKLGLHFYTRDPNQDLKLVQWYMRLVETGDLDHLISKDSHRLYPFLTIFQDAFLVYTEDSKGRINFAAWFVPSAPADYTSPPYVGVWLSDVKGSKHSLDCIYIIYSMAFEIWPSLLGFTWQPEHLEIHRKLGYNIIGSIPNYQGRSIMHIVHLTKEDFEGSRLARAALRR